MDGDTQPIASQVWLPADLATFFTELRLAGFNVGLEEYLTAERLLLGLGADGRLPADPREIRTLLRPICCNSPQEQEDFDRRFFNWLGLPADEPPPTARPPAETGRVDDVDLRSQQRLLKTAYFGRWTFQVLLLLGLLPAAAMLVSSEPVVPSGPPAGTAPPTPGKTEAKPGQLAEAKVLPSEVADAAPPAASNRGIWAFSLLAALAGCWAAFEYSWWRRARRYVQGLVPESVPSLGTDRFRLPEQQLFAAAPFFHMAQKLRRHRRVSSNVLDAEQTIAATVRHGGLYTPVVKRRPEHPEYLVLIDQDSTGSSHRQLFEELFERFEREGVLITRFRFLGDPRQCFPETAAAPPDPCPLAELADRFPDHRLIVCTDGERFLDPVAGGPQAWVELFRRWPQRVLLTLVPSGQWTARERELGEIFSVLPFSQDGLAEAAELLSAGEPASGLLWETPAAEAFPPLLEDRPERWLDEYPPSGASAPALVGQLRSYLGREAYLWFAACAVFPSLTWNITLALGRGLRSPAGEPLLSESRLVAMLRLPWFRRGNLPSWLRKQLLADLPRAVERQTREILTRLLLSAVRDDQGDLAVHAAETHGRFSLLAAATLNVVARGWSRNHPWRERIFTGFLTNRLSFRVPRDIGLLLGNHGTGGGFRLAPSPLEHRLYRVGHLLSLPSAGLLLVWLGTVIGVAGDEWLSILKLIAGPITITGLMATGIAFLVVTAAARLRLPVYLAIAATCGFTICVADFSYWQWPLWVSYSAVGASAVLLILLNVLVRRDLHQPREACPLAPLLQAERIACATIGAAMVAAGYGLVFPQHFVTRPAVLAELLILPALTAVSLSLGYAVRSAWTTALGLVCALGWAACLVGSEALACQFLVACLPVQLANWWRPRGVPSKSRSWMHRGVSSAAVVVASVMLFVLIDLAQERLWRTPSGTGGNRVVLPFVTDREREPEATFTDARADDSLNYGIGRVSLPLQHAIGELEGPSIWNLEFQQNPSRHVILEEVQVQSEQTFLADVRASLASSRNRELVIWIHGFNVSFDQAMHRGAQVHHDVRFEGVWVTYSWPAPKNYVECEGNAVWTVPHLLETLELLTARSGAKRIHVVAHGMGCRVALSAVSELGVKGKRVLSQVVLCAPDIDAAVFWQQVAPRLPNVAERTVILVSSNDWALVAASKAHGYRRVGTDTSKRSMIPGIDTIDVSDRGTGLLGHSYYGDSPTILEDIRRILAGQPLSANAP